MNQSAIRERENQAGLKYLNALRSEGVLDVNVDRDHRDHERQCSATGAKSLNEDEQQSNYNRREASTRPARKNISLSKYRHCGGRLQIVRASTVLNAKKETPVENWFVMPKSTRNQNGKGIDEPV